MFSFVVCQKCFFQCLGVKWDTQSAGSTTQGIDDSWSSLDTVYFVNLLRKTMTRLWGIKDDFLLFVKIVFLCDSWPYWAYLAMIPLAMEYNLCWVFPWSNFVVCSEKSRLVIALSNSILLEFSRKTVFQSHFKKLQVVKRPICPNRSTTHLEFSLNIENGFLVLSFWEVVDFVKNRSCFPTRSSLRLLFSRKRCLIGTIQGNFKHLPFEILRGSINRRFPTSTQVLRFRLENLRTFIMRLLWATSWFEVFGSTVAIRCLMDWRLKLWWTAKRERYTL